MVKNLCLQLALLVIWHLAKSDVVHGDIEDDLKADLEAQPVLKTQKLRHDEGERVHSVNWTHLYICAPHKLTCMYAMAISYTWRLYPRTSAQRLHDDVFRHWTKCASSSILVVYVLVTQTCHLSSSPAKPLPRSKITGVIQRFPCSCHAEQLTVSRPSSPSDVLRSLF